MKKVKMFIFMFLGVFLLIAVFLAIFCGFIYVINYDGLHIIWKVIITLSAIAIMITTVMFISLKR